jgi:HEAT repeat protein
VDALLELRESVLRDPSPQARAAACRALAGLAAPGAPAPEGALELGLLILESAEAAELEQDGLRGDLLRSVSTCLATKRSALEELEAVHARLRPAQLRLVVEALLLAERADADGLLLELLETHANEAPRILAALGAVLGKRPFEGRADVEAALARCLLDPTPETRAAAARAAGEAQLDGVAWALLECLGDESNAVATSARGALRTLCGSDFGFDPGAFGELVERERRFVEHGGLAVLMSAVRGEDAIAASEALKELAAHRLLARRIGVEVGALLGDLAPKLQRQAALVLAELGARTAVPELVALLASGAEEETRAAVRTALVELTGRDFGESYAAWRTWLVRT